MNMKLVKGADPILRTAAEKFDFSNPEIDPVELSLNMTDKMSKLRIMGLSANQFGLPLQVMTIGNPADTSSAFAAFNPFITSYGEEMAIEEEMNPCFPGLFIKIKRPTSIRVRYTTAEMKTDVIKFDGITARVFQHQYDQLQGLLYTKKANRYYLEKAIKQKKKLDKIRKGSVLL